MFYLKNLDADTVRYTSSGERGILKKGVANVISHNLSILWVMKGAIAGWSSSCRRWQSCGSLLSIAMLCNMAQAPIIRQTFSGFILTSEWSKWNLRFHHPKVCSMATLVALWAWLNASSFTDVGLRYGVMRYGLQGYPLSPRSKPSSNVRGWDSNLWPINELLNTKLSSVLPGHRATMFVNVPKEISTINFVLYCVIP